MEQTIKKLNWTNLVTKLKTILMYLLNKSSGETTVSAEDITDATTLGKELLKASNAASARTAIGAGTSNLAIGTTASTAKAGNYVPSWSEVSGKPATFAPTIGTTASTAKAGNYVPTWTEVTGKPSTFTPSAHTHAWADITGKPSTFTPTIGTTATTAKAGNYQPTAANISDASEIGRTVLTATDANAVRSAIGAGTSNLSLGSTASTAAAGNHSHTATQVTATAVGTGTATNVQGILAELEARITALESA